MKKGVRGILFEHLASKELISITRKANQVVREATWTTVKAAWPPIVGRSRP